MEPNSLGGGGASGGMFPGISSSMLGLELPLHQNPSNPHQLHHPPMVSFVPHEARHHQQPPPPAVKYPYPAKPKPQQSNLSDEEEQGFADDSNSDAKKKISPWQRMKWTDMMVRLLITAVFYIGDEGGSEPMDHASKKKQVGLLQKKGKWKSVSRAMMEKGFYVSPQQCEDKFNDLNKRYKRVNDILGKGTATTLAVMAPATAAAVPIPHRRRGQNHPNFHNNNNSNDASTRRRPPLPRRPARVRKAEMRKRRMRMRRMNRKKTMRRRRRRRLKEVREHRKRRRKRNRRRGREKKGLRQGFSG